MATTHAPDIRWSEATCRLEDLLAVLAERTDPHDFPLATEVVDDVLVYDAGRLLDAPAEAARAELVRALADGPGVVVVRGAFPDRAVVDRATAAFDAMIAEQRAAGAVAGDHFAKPGANDRVWNALEKLAVHAPEVFVDYYANDVLALVSTAWLGPGYQVTSQVNVVNPGGDGAGRAPRLPPRFPAARAHRSSSRRTCTVLSPVLTLQGAVAHSDMPVESGPTHVPAALAEVRARLPRLAAARVPRVLRAPPRPAAAGQGRRGLLQPGAVPRRRHQPVHGRPADGEPAAGLLGVRAGDGDASTGTGSCRAVYPALLRARPGAGDALADASRRAPRATRSPPTSTATRRSTGWPRPARPTSSGGRWPRTGRPRRSMPH